MFFSNKNQNRFFSRIFKKYLYRVRSNIRVLNPSSSNFLHLYSFKLFKEKIFLNNAFLIKRNIKDRISLKATFNLTGGQIPNGDVNASHFHKIRDEKSENSKNVGSEKNIKQLYQITCKQSLILNNRNFYSSFYLGPFVSGQSLTIANSLRRTLLSELYGIAILAIEIEGVNHEYSNIQGVKETVLDIVLNLKEIVLKPNARIQNISTFVSEIGVFDHLAFLQVSGPGIIRARDIKLPPYLLLVDPDQYIATLADDGFLNMKLYIAFGQNFNNSSELLKKKFADFQEKLNIVQSSSSHNSEQMNDPARLDLPINTSKSSIALTKKNLKSKILDLKENANKMKLSSKNDEIFNLTYGQTLNEDKENESNRKLTNILQNGIISKKQIKSPFILYLDPVFMPVTKVNYIIEENPLDFSSQIIFLEIWTNGSLHPRKALQEGLKKLVNIFFCFWEYQNTKFLTNLKKKNIEKHIHTFFEV